MRLFLSVLAVSAVAFGLRTHSELDMSYSYSEYLGSFGKRAPLGAEWNERKAIFQRNLKLALAHNAGPSTWKRGINQFSDWRDDEIKAMMGRKKGMEHLSTPTSMFKSTTSPHALPDEVHWCQDKGVCSPVKDQGHCGSCWAFASTAVMESHLAISTGVLSDLGVQQVVSCVENKKDCGGYGGCDGATAELAFEYVSKNGLSNGYVSGYTSYWGANGTCPSADHRPATMNVTGYTKLPVNDPNALQEAVATKGPIAISIAAVPFVHYEKGVFDGCDTSGDGTDIDHAVVLTGYGHDEKLNVDYWEVRNSWSPLWGENGFIRVKRTADDAKHCGTDKTPQDGTECAGGAKETTVCGMCGILWDSAYPEGAELVK